MRDATYQYLADRGLARGEARANTGALADLCIEQLLQRVVRVPELDEIQDKGLLTAELRDLVLGVPDDEDIEADLDALIARLVSPDGIVQHRLENGFVLCSAHASRTLTGADNGKEVVVTRLARFLSDAADVIEAFFLTPQHDAAVKKAQGLNARWELAISRKPEMEARRQAFLSKTQQRLQLELTV